METILKCADIEGKTEELIDRGYEDEGDVLIKNLSKNSTICIDKETGIVADVTEDGVSCEGLVEIVELKDAGIVETSKESEEVVEDAKATADGADA